MGIHAAVYTNREILMPRHQSIRIRSFVEQRAFNRNCARTKRFARDPNHFRAGREFRDGRNQVQKITNCIYARASPDGTLMVRDPKARAVGH